MGSKARFRIRTRDGRDLEPRTLEVLAELVRSGAIGPDDLVFDALTNEWAPARTHTVVRMFSDGGALPAGEEEDEAGPAERREGASGAFGSLVDHRPRRAGEEDLSFDLVSVEAPSPEEEAETFIARMEEERRHDGETPELFREGEVGPAETDPADFSDAGPAIVGGVRAEDAVSAVPSSFRPPTRGLRRARQRTRGRGWALAGVVPIGVLVVASAVARPTPDPVAGLGAGEAAAAEPRAPRSIPGSEARLRETAYARFVADVDRLRLSFEIEEVPSEWLEGRYLAEAAAYPEVRGYFERVLSYAEEAYASEVELYRRAYLDVSEEAGVGGPVRSLRLAAAVEDFEASRRLREAHYARVWDLAHSALALHDQLVHLRGRITYEPARGQRVSADPVIEAAGADPEAQTRLEAALDRVLGDLRGPQQGPLRPRVEIPRWLTEGLRGEAPATS